MAMIQHLECQHGKKLFWADKHREYLPDDVHRRALAAAGEADSCRPAVRVLDGKRTEIPAPRRCTCPATAAA